MRESIVLLKLFLSHKSKKKKEFEIYAQHP